MRSQVHCKESKEKNIDSLKIRSFSQIDVEEEEEDKEGEGVGMRRRKRR